METGHPLTQVVETGLYCGMRVKIIIIIIIIIIVVIIII